MKDFRLWWKRIPLELLFWLASVLAILSIDPFAKDAFSLCPLDQLGITWCPGCGLGRAMHLLLVGELQASWSMHPLAGFALVAILHRVFSLIKQVKTSHRYG